MSGLQLRSSTYLFPDPPWRYLTFLSSDFHLKNGNEKCPGSSQKELRLWLWKHIIKHFFQSGFTRVLVYCCTNKRSSKSQFNTKKKRGRGLFNSSYTFHGSGTPLLLVPETQVMGSSVLTAASTASMPVGKGCDEAHIGSKIFHLEVTHFTSAHIAFTSQVRWLTPNFKREK